MRIEDIQPELFLLFNKAKSKFEECINDEDNKFLLDELNLSSQEIVVIEKDIKIVFYKRSFERFYFEISLVLFDGKNEIGKYSYIENEKGESVDDSLVFY
jgi:hypothetical protein